VIPSKQEDQAMEAIKQEITGLIKDKGLEGSVGVKLQERGIEITLSEKIMFDSGKTDISKDSEQLIIKIGKEILSNVQNKSIKIEGHTDNIPMTGNSIIKNNLDLSSLRASNVANLLIEKCGIKKENVKAVGCGDSVPLIDNDSDKHRAMNRRVAIVILRDAYDGSEANSENNNTGTTSNSAIK
jgi:chemotaxis protein MotB